MKRCRRACLGLHPEGKMLPEKTWITEFGHEGGMPHSVARAWMSKRMIMWKLKSMRLLRESRRGVTANFDEYIVVKLPIVKKAAPCPAFGIGVTESLGREKQVE